MNVKKSQKAFVGATITTVLSIALVLIVYAALLANIPGGEVTVGGVTGNIYYSTDNTEPGTWTSTLSLSGTGNDWYARFNTTGGEYVGPVTIAWQLQQKQGDGSWSNLGSATTTTITLTSGAQTIYATSDGLGPTGNRDWSLTATSTASYRVMVTINSTG